MTPRAGVRFHGPQPRTAGRILLPYGYGLVSGYPVPGWKRVTSGTPVTVFLVAAVCGKRGRAFCARWE